MKYVVPVQAADEVSALVHAGAGELYCGYQDSWWVERYGDHDSASRRQGRANLATLDELCGTANIAAEQGIPLYLALNARYTEPQLDYLEDLCRRFWDMGGTGVIVSDLGLLWRLRDVPGLKKCLSILAVAQNVPTLKAFQKLGVTRVVLPRFMDAPEAGALMSAVAPMEAEVMAFFDKCPWVDGYCRHRHGVSYAPREVARGVEAPKAAPLYTFDTTYVTHACLQKSITYIEPYPCAACFLPEYEAGGVGYAKLGGRGRLLEERLRALRFLCKSTELGSHEDRALLYQSTYQKNCACYYGDALQNRSAIEAIPLPQDSRYGIVLGSQTRMHDYLRDCAKIAGGAYRDDSNGVMLCIPPLSQSDLETLINTLQTQSYNFPARFALCVNDLGTYITCEEYARRQFSNATSEQSQATNTTTASCPFVYNAKTTTEGYPLVYNAETTTEGYPSLYNSKSFGENYSLSYYPQIEVIPGTLLSRLDDPAEVKHFLSPAENPPRPIWGPNAEPRTLTYQAPPQTLIDHWTHPSFQEPSAQSALKFLLNIPQQNSR